MVKLCSRCRQLKLESDFYSNKRVPCGLTSRCKICVAIAANEWKTLNPERWKQIRRTAKRKPKYKAYASRYFRSYRLANRDKLDRGRKVLRFAILARDNFSCQYCGRKAPDVKLQIDHVHPKSRGGKNCADNYKTACADCNIGKSDYLLEELMHSLQMENKNPACV